MHNIDENEVLRDALAGLNEEVPPMPEGLHAAWMQKVEDDMHQTHTEKTRTMKTVTRWLSIAAAVVFVFGGTLLTKDYLSLEMSANQAASADTKTVMLQGARSYADDYSYTAGAVVEEGYEVEAAMNTGVMLTSARGSGATTAATDIATTEKKIIRTAGMTIKTQRYDEALASLESTCLGQGGWIESTNENTNSYSGLRTAYLTLRVPQETLDSFLEGTEGLGRVTSRNESAQDVTASYQDTQTRLNTQLALMERLQALITESADLSDLLALESQIADTQYQIDTLQTSLNRTDRQVSYSTVRITLQEEKAPELTDTSVSFGDRLLSAIKTGFNALESFLELYDPDCVVIQKVERNISDYLNEPPILTGPKAELPDNLTFAATETTVQVEPCMYNANYVQFTGTVDPERLTPDTQVLVAVGDTVYRAYHTGEDQYLLYLKTADIAAPSAEVQVYLLSQDKCIQALSEALEIPQ